MKSFKHRIESKEGIHARPATNIVNSSKQFVSKITILFNDKVVDAKRMLALMSLNAKKDDVIIVNIEGEDENIAVEELEKVLKENL